MDVVIRETDPVPVDEKRKRYVRLNLDMATFYYILRSLSDIDDTEKERLTRLMCEYAQRYKACLEDETAPEPDGTQIQEILATYRARYAEQWNTYQQAIEMREQREACSEYYTLIQQYAILMRLASTGELTILTEDLVHIYTYLQALESCIQDPSQPRPFDDTISCLIEEIRQAHSEAWDQQIERIEQLRTQTNRPRKEQRPKRNNR